MMNYSRTSGFTILELVVVMAIIATATVALYPAYASLSTRKDFQESVNIFESTLATTRLQAFSRATTTRINITRNNDIYSISTFASAAPTNTCTAGGTWQQLSTRNIDLNSQFVISGTSIGNTCFFRDGTSTGGALNFAQKDGGDEIGRAAINIYISTGFVDVTER